MRKVSLLAGAVAAASTAVVIAIGASKDDASFDLAAIVFAVALMVLGGVPYLVTWTCAGSGRPYLRRWAAWALTLYGLGDLTIRVQVFFFPQSSTDGVALITYPIVGAAATFALAAVPAALFTHVSMARPPM